MQLTRFLRTLVVGALTLLFGSMLHAQEIWNFPDFTATQVFQSQRGEMAMKVYRSGSSVRVERSAALSTLYETAGGKVYNLTVYPDHSRQCVAMKPAQAKMLPVPWSCYKEES